MSENVHTNKAFKEECNYPSGRTGLFSLTGLSILGNCDQHALQMERKIESETKGENLSGEEQMELRQLRKEVKSVLFLLTRTIQNNRK